MLDIERISIDINNSLDLIGAKLTQIQNATIDYTFNDSQKLKITKCRGRIEEIKRQADRVQSLLK